MKFSVSMDGSERAELGAKPPHKGAASCGQETSMGVHKSWRHARVREEENTEEAGTARTSSCKGTTGSAPIARTGRTPARSSVSAAARGSPNWSAFVERRTSKAGKQGARERPMARAGRRRASRQRQRKPPVLWRPLRAAHPLRRPRRPETCGTFTSSSNRPHGGGSHNHRRTRRRPPSPRRPSAFWASAAKRLRSTRRALPSA